jgi:tetrachloro-p-hydroquinone reductive dehalogenase
MLELFHAAPSYYSMVARLALAEAGVAYVSRLMDIHLAKQQLSPAYRKLNPHMTVPTLRGPGLLLTDSAQILIYAAQQAAQRPEQSWADVDASRAEAIQRAVAGHYALSIETLTFGKVLATRPWFKAVMVRMLSGINAKLERDIAGKPDQAALLAAVSATASVCSG